jgi:hypothetical protein
MRRIRKDKMCNTCVNGGGRRYRNCGGLSSDAIPMYLVDQGSKLPLLTLWNLTEDRNERARRVEIYAEQYQRLGYLDFDAVAPPPLTDNGSGTGGGSLQISLWEQDESLCDEEL